VAPPQTLLWGLISPPKPPPLSGEERGVEGKEREREGEVGKGRGGLQSL